MDDFIYGEPIALPAISIDDATVLEGNSGTTNAVFTLTLSTAAPLPVSVAYSVSPSTADMEDFHVQTGSILFDPNQTSKTLTVAINADTSFEPDETFLVELSHPGNATIAHAQGIGRIQNDDVQPSLSIGDVTEPEGDSGTLATLTVTLSNTTAQTVTVDYATVDGTAVSPADYRGVAGTLTFVPEQARRRSTCS